MPRAEKDKSADTRSSPLPYNQAGRKAKMLSTRGWSPSLWNAFTFWKTNNLSNSEEGDGEHEAKEPVDNSTSDDNGSAAMSKTCQGSDHDASLMNCSNSSEEQVFNHLTMQSPRHSAVDTSPRQSPHRPYTAPLPPSSPLHQSNSPHEDPLAKVSQYIENVLRPRGGECTDVEALGLSMLIQSSVNHPGSRELAQPGTSWNINPFLLPAINSVPATGSVSPSPVRPTFTNPGTDLASLLASSPNALGSSLPKSVSNTASPSTSSPSRTLTHNPNGSIYYQGGGSARLRSPGFGTPPARRKVAFPRSFGEGRNDEPKLNGVLDIPSPSDGKRRRVGEDKDSSIAEASGSRSAVLNGTGMSSRSGPSLMTGLRNGPPSPTPRLMASMPTRPSPLRQSIHAESHSTGSFGYQDSNGGTPGAMVSDASEEGRTRASQIMAGIINDATPKKDSVDDIRNPYEPNNRSPTKRSRKPPSRAPRPPPRPARQMAGTSSTSQSSKKLNALETIERTAPQSQMRSTRSQGRVSPPVAPSATENGNHDRTRARQAGSSAEEPLTIELDDDGASEQQTPPVKKQKLENYRLRQEEKHYENDPNVPIPRDVDDVDMEVASSDNINPPPDVIEHDNGFSSQQAHNHPQSQSQPQFPQDAKRSIIMGTFKKGAVTTRFQSVPKDPSPLRQSFQPDAPPSPPQDPAPSGGVSFAQTTQLSLAPSPAASSTPSSEFASSMPSPFLSTLITPGPQLLLSSSLSAEEAPLAIPPLSANGATDWLALAKKQVLEVPISSLPTFAFVFTTSIPLSEYSIQRDTALAVCPTDLPKFDFTGKSGLPPSLKTKKEVKGFDWGAAGMKPPELKGWTCNSCSCTNDDMSSTQCYVCNINKA